jgi:ribosomal-protein-alanine N-acetyltransferase
VDEYRIEFAHPADAAHLAAMSQQLVEAGLAPSWGRERIRSHVLHPESVVLVARHAGGIAGFAIMRYADTQAHLNLLAVEPAHRRHGVGRDLVRWLEETALTAGTFVIGLELREGNVAARAFYSALGYRELARVSGYYQGVETAIRMQRDVRESRA